MSEIVDVTDLYSKRFNAEDRVKKDMMWQVLCRHFFQRYVRPSDVVLDLGAGYCEFINNIDCAQRIAVDVNPDVHHFAADGVRVLLTSSTNIGELEADSVDVIFASNFFEHLPDKDAFMQTLREIKRLLRTGGRLLTLQPNIRVLGGSYWDFLDHHIALTDRTVVEALSSVGFEVAEVRPRFLPYTTKSRLPSHPLLVRLYLMARPAHLLLGKQAWIVGVKTS